MHMVQLLAARRLRGASVIGIYYSIQRLDNEIKYNDKSKT